MKITCDICDGLLHMDAGGKTASCSVCGMIHSIERVREKIQQMNAPAEPAAPAEEVFAEDVQESTVMEEPVCEPTPEEDPFYSTDIFTQAASAADDEVYDAECTEVPENLLSVIERVEEEYVEQPAVDSVSIPEEFNIGDAPDSGLTLLKYIGAASTVIVPEGVESVGELFKEDPVFLHPETLRKVILNRNLSFIGCAAFKGCCNLEKIIIPSSVCMFGTPSEGDVFTSHAFEGCTGLKSVMFEPNSRLCADGPVKADALFRGCISLEHAELPDCPDFYEVYVSMFEGCERLTEVILPKNISVIGPSAFKGCGSLQEIYLDNVCIIGPHAFQNCYNLEQVHLPDHPVAIHPTAFEGCPYKPPVEYTRIRDFKNCPVCGGSIRKLVHSCKNCGTMLKFPGSKKDWK